jgi:hypothetical protein
MSGWMHEYIVDDADGTSRTGYVIEARAPRSRRWAGRCRT